MHPSRCIVTFADSHGTRHEVQVWANTVYEAVASAVRDFQSGGLSKEKPGPSTGFAIAVHREPVTHRLKLQQLTRWADGGGKSPQDTMERNRIKELLKSGNH